MPNQIDTRRMIPVKPETHTWLKQEVETLKLTTGNKNKSFDDLLNAQRKELRELRAKK